jgi:hypothetical protein
MARANGEHAEAPPTPLKGLELEAGSIRVASLAMSQSIDIPKSQVHAADRPIFSLGLLLAAGYLPLGWMG